MSYTIKNKLFEIIDENREHKSGIPYIHPFSLKFHLILFFSSLLYVGFSFFIRQFLTYGGSFTFVDLIVVIYVSFLPIVIILTMIFPFLIISFPFKKKIGFFSYLKNIQNNERSIISEFGSIQNLVNLKDRLISLNLDLSDDNFYKIYKDPSFYKKFIKIQNKKDDRINRVDEKIQRLISKKESINLEFLSKERVLVKN